MTSKQIAKNLIEAPIDEELGAAYLEYAMSVVHSRAIPNAIDGLQPVARRLLYSMQISGATHEKEYSKSAKHSSLCMGNHHPHGDLSIYFALVKLAQPFYQMLPMIDGYGNFGDVTGSGPAAARYTEARLDKAAQFMLSEIKEKVVPMIPNYDGTLEEPTVLPAMFPNMLVNGNMGIGVGFASKLPPHNLAEIVEGTKLLMKNPDATLEQLMKKIPAPDFPTGGKIIGLDAVKEAYETGRGIFQIQSQYRIKQLPGGKSQIDFYEIPYDVSTESIRKKVNDLRELGKLGQVTDIEDLTDHANGLQLSVILKAGANPKAVVLELFKLTPLQSSFGINNTVLIDGGPVVAGLKQLLQVWIDARRVMVVNRSTFRKDKREKRLHIIEGLLKTLADIDTVIKIVRGADSSAQAQEQLMKRFKLDTVQADHVLSIPLRQLTRFDQIKLEDENKTLIDELEELNKILNDSVRLDEVIVDELNVIKKSYGQARLSEISGVTLEEFKSEVKEAVATLDTEIADEACVLSLSYKNSIVRAAKPKPNNLSFANTTTRGKFVAVSNRGRAWRLESITVTERATSIQGILPEPLEKGEKIIALTPVALQNDKLNGGIALGTKSGSVKVVSPQWPVRADEFAIIGGLEEGDEILSAAWVEDTKLYDFVFVSSDTSLLSFKAELVRPQGLSGAGVAGLKLADGASAVAFGVVLKSDVTSEAQVVTVSDKNNGKTTPLVMYPQKGRATGGVRAQALLKGETELIYAYVGTFPHVEDLQGNIIAPPVLIPKRDASGKPLDNGALDA